MGTVIATIGHGAAGFDEVLEVLRLHGVATLVDVRSRPYSRHAPDFAKGRLEEACAAAGVGYRWMGADLGGRPSDPRLLDPRGELDPDALGADPGFRSAVRTVAAIASGGKPALLCSEQAPEHCHRATLLAPELIALGHRVEHLRHDGSATPHQEPLELA